MRTAEGALPRRAAEFGAARARVGTAMREGRSDEGRTGALPRRKGAGRRCGVRRGGAGSGAGTGAGMRCAAGRGGERENVCVCVCVCVCDRERASVRRVGGPGGGAG